MERESGGGVRDKATGRFCGRLSWWAIAAILAAGGGAALATAQTDAPRSFSADSESLPIDVTVRVVNGTTGQPGHADAVTLQEFGQRGPAIASDSDVTGATVLRGLFLDETRSYLVQATDGGISYFAKATGQDLAGGPVTVYVFETTTDRSAIAVSELDLTVKRIESRLDLEYMIAIANEASPQQTVLPDPFSFELLLPQDASGSSFEVLGGATPMRVTPVAGGKPGYAALAIPLRSGTTRLRVTTTVPCPGRAKLELAASAPVKAFTLLAAPSDLEVTGDFFKDQGLAEQGGYRRWEGPALAANAVLAWQVSGGTGPQIAQRREGLSGLGRKAQERVREARSDKRAVTITIIGLAVIILLLAARRRLR